MQIGNDLSSMQKQMKNSQMNITAVSAISKNRQTIFYVIWRSSSFSWQNHQIPITRLKSIGNKSNRLLDEEIQRVMQIEQIPSLSIAVITDKGLRISKAYGFADIRQRKNVCLRSIMAYSSSTLLLDWVLTEAKNWTGNVVDGHLKIKNTKFSIDNT